jgi:hypothetical protein
MLWRHYSGRVGIPSNLYAPSAIFDAMSNFYLTYQQVLPLRFVSLFVVFGVVLPCLAVLVATGFEAARALALNAVPRLRAGRYHT